jgi:hypothetical protein
MAQDDRSRFVLLRVVGWEVVRRSNHSAASWETGTNIDGDTLRRQFDHEIHELVGAEVSAQSRRTVRVGNLRVASRRLCASIRRRQPPGQRTFGTLIALSAETTSLRIPRVLRIFSLAQPTGLIDT